MLEELTEGRSRRVSTGNNFTIVAIVRATGCVRMYGSASVLRSPWRRGRFLERLSRTSFTRLLSVEMFSDLLSFDKFLVFADL